MNAKKRKEFADRVRQGEYMTLPGVFDLISARVADGMAFPGLYMTGYGVVASSLGLPDAGLASYTEMVNCVAKIAQGTAHSTYCRWRHRVWWIVECRTYRARLRASRRGGDTTGGSGVSQENVVIPPDRKVIPIEDMVAKIKVAVASQGVR